MFTIIGLGPQQHILSNSSRCNTLCCVTKPFSPKILIARVKSLLRRSPSKAAGRIVSTPHGVSLDTGKRKCFVSGEEIPLTATEFDILLSLISADGCVRRRTEIIEEIKGDDYPVTERSIDVQIAALRKKLGSAGIIESRSLGMKGTYIKVLSPLFLEELGIAAK